MQHAMTSVATKTYTEKNTFFSLLNKFFIWSERQEKYRFGWLAAAITIHGCILTPLVVSIVLASGGNFALFMTSIVAMAMTLIVNLAALPTKISIPTFFLSVVIDIVVMLICFCI